MSDLPSRPPPGMTRYRAITRDPKENPFKPLGPTRAIQTVDVPDDTPQEQVEEWARETAEEAGYVFLELEKVT